MPYRCLLVAAALSPPRFVPAISCVSRLLVMYFATFDYVAALALIAKASRVYAYFFGNLLRCAIKHK